MNSIPFWENFLSALCGRERLFFSRSLLCRRCAFCRSGGFLCRCRFLVGSRRCFLGRSRCCCFFSRGRFFIRSFFVGRFWSCRGCLFSRSCFFVGCLWRRCRCFFSRGRFLVGSGTAAGIFSRGFWRGCFRSSHFCRRRCFLGGSGCTFLSGRRFLVRRSFLVGRRGCFFGGCGAFSRCCGSLLGRCSFFGCCHYL